MKPLIPYKLFLRKKDSIQQQTDEELLNAYKAGKASEYAEALFSRYCHLIYGTCMKYLKDQDESKDAVMQVFEKVFAELDQHEIRNFKGWIHTVARNHCLMKLRSESRRTMVRDEEGEYLMEKEQSMHLYIEDEENTEKQVGQLEDCIGKLIKEQKNCVELFYLQEKSYQEVSKLTGYSMNEVKSYIQNGKRNLKNCMGNRHE